MSADAASDTAPSFSSFAEVRKYVIENADKIATPDYESHDYFCHGWLDENHLQRIGPIEERPALKVGDLIIYESINDDRCFYRYGIVAKIFLGTVVSNREIFVAYDVGPALVMSTHGSVVAARVEYYPPIRLCKNIARSEWMHADDTTFSLTQQNLNLQQQVRQAKKKIEELTALLKR